MWLICSYDVPCSAIIRKETSSRWREKQLLPRSKYYIWFCLFAEILIPNIYLFLFAEMFNSQYFDLARFSVLVKII